MRALLLALFCARAIAFSGGGSSCTINSAVDSTKCENYNSNRECPSHSCSAALASLGRHAHVPLASPAAHLFVHAPRSCAATGYAYFGSWTGTDPDAECMKCCVQFATAGSNFYFTTGPNGECRCVTPGAAHDAM